MPLILRTASRCPLTSGYDVWFATTDTPAVLPRETHLPDIAHRLEAAFLAERATWWQVGRSLQLDAGAWAAHMPTCGSFGSDFGITLAWGRVASDLTMSEETVLCVCDDPWLFRHLAKIEGVNAGTAPNLLTAKLKLSIRGWLARCKVAVQTARAALAMRQYRPAIQTRDSVLLVYGHPESTTNGHDAYFGDLMTTEPLTKRLLHTDCPPARAAGLATDKRTASLHGWGSALFALGAPFFRWKPSAAGPYRWLIDRAAAHENGGGGPAMNRWQHHCQTRFLSQAKPKTVIWPWENHGWERAFVRTARAAGIKTVGYQHTVIGPFQINYSPRSNHDGLASIPDIVATDGPAYAQELRNWDVPDNQLVDAGALRLKPITGLSYESKAPVLVLMSAIQSAAGAQIRAAQNLANAGWQVLVKAHPMYDVKIPSGPNLKRTETPLHDFKHLAGVIYSTGASGMEARLSGVPALRVLFNDRIAIDVLPEGLSNPTATTETVVDVFRTLTPPPAVSWHDVFSEPKPEVWRNLLSDDTRTPENISQKAETP